MLLNLNKIKIEFKKPNHSFPLGVVFSYFKWIWKHFLKQKQSSIGQKTDHIVKVKLRSQILYPTEKNERGTISTSTAYDRTLSECQLAIVGKAVSHFQV